MKYHLNYWNRPEREALLRGITEKINFHSNEAPLRLQILIRKHLGSHFKNNTKYLKSCHKNSCGNPGFILFTTRKSRWGLFNNCLTSSRIVTKLINSENSLSQIVIFLVMQHHFGYSQADIYHRSTVLSFVSIPCRSQTFEIVSTD